MATIGTALTLRDVARRLDPNGKIDMITELLNDTNELLDDMLWKEGNLVTGHSSTIRTGLPTAYWRLLNQGVPISKSTTRQVIDAVGMMEQYGEVDVDVAKLNGNSAEFMLSENKPHIESMSQEMASTLVYGSTATSPEEFNGLDVRYNEITTTDTLSGYNIIDGGGTGGDNTSIWLVVWGSNTVFGIYPKGSKAGLVVEDLGAETKATDSDNTAGSGLTGLQRVYRQRYQWKAGLVVKDWRYCVRIANIDYPNLMADTSAADLVKLMIQAEERIPNLSGGRPVFYVHRDVRTCLRNQILAKNNVNLTFDNVGGKPVVMFNGIPVKRLDALTVAEAQIT